MNGEFGCAIIEGENCSLDLSFHPLGLTGNFLVTVGFRQERLSIRDSTYLARETYKISQVS